MTDMPALEGCTWVLMSDEHVAEMRRFVGPNPTPNPATYAGRWASGLLALNPLPTSGESDAS